MTLRTVVASASATHQPGLDDLVAPDGSCRMPKMQGQLRCLDPHVLGLLGQVQCAARLQVALAPAALLMEELHDKLVEAMTRARRPAFPKAAAVQDQPSGKLRNLSCLHSLHSHSLHIHSLATRSLHTHSPYAKYHKLFRTPHAFAEGHITPDAIL